MSENWNLPEGVIRTGNVTTFTCSVCGLTKMHESSFTTGYGRDPETDAIVCYDCCAVQDRKSMDETGRATLYLHKNDAGKWELTNWPGTLRYPARVSKGFHNIARTRYDAWFTDHLGKKWHGVNIGEYSEICHCKRLKE